jgi:hypothetical protein
MPSLAGAALAAALPGAMTIGMAGGAEEYRVMSMSVGASSNALSYLQSLLGQSTSGAGDAAGSDPLSALLQSLSGASQPATAPAIQPATQSGASPGAGFSANTMAALISLQGEQANGVTAASPSALFAKLDSNGDGQISKSEFETALSGVGVGTSSADALFAKLDSNGDGEISQSELTSARPSHGHHHHAHGGGKGGGSSAQSGIDSLLSAAGADGATTQTATNADGSTTTTITYADGSTIASTSPAAAAGSGTASGGTGNPSSGNLLAQLTQLQSQLIAAAKSTVSAVA